jgi:hypothetical protein
MKDDNRITALKAFLEMQKVGLIDDKRRVANLEAAAWDKLEIRDHTNMRADKLWRMESPRWNPPTFCSKSSDTAPRSMDRRVLPCTTGRSTSHQGKPQSVERGVGKSPQWISGST